MESDANHAIAFWNVQTREKKDPIFLNISFPEIIFWKIDILHLIWKIFLLSYLCSWLNSCSHIISK